MLSTLCSKQLQRTHNMLIGQRNRGSYTIKLWRYKFDNGKYGKSDGFGTAAYLKA